MAGRMITPHGLMAARTQIIPDDDDEKTRLKLEIMNLKAVIRQLQVCIRDADSIIKNSGPVDA